MNNECALCFGLYEDDLSITGKLEREWLQCTNTTCEKWMHAECLNAEDGIFICGACFLVNRWLTDAYLDDYDFIVIQFLVRQSFYVCG